LSKIKKLYLTEKDSQVEALAPILGCKYQKKWHPAFSPDGSIVIAPLQGHLMELAMPEEYDEKYKEWNYSTNFFFPKNFIVKPKERTKHILARAIKLLNQAEEIIIATDDDNEGAALAMRVIEKAGATHKVSSMIKMGALDKTNLTKAVKSNQSVPYKAMANAGYARAYIDLAEGITLTRTLTLSLGGGNLVLFGGVKTPVLELVVKRDLAYENHQESYYYTLPLEVEINNFIFKAAVFKKSVNEKGKTVYEDKFETEEELKKVKNFLENNKLSVSAFGKKQSKESPPRLYDLTSLQADIAQQLKLNPDKSLEIAQKFYDQYKITTYPRTAVKYITEEEYSDVPTILSNIKELFFQKEIDSILSQEIPKRKSVFNTSEVTSHGALIPTLEKVKGKNLTDTELEFYKIIAKRYVANFLPDAEYETSKGLVYLFDNYYIIFDKKQMTKDGWRVLYDENTDKKIASYQNIIVNKNDNVEIISDTDIKKNKTKPKPRYTYKTLLNAMENIARVYPNNPEIKEFLGENGIGTPATRSTIIKELMEPDRNGEPYLIQKGNQIVSTQKARDIISVIPSFISSPAKRAQLTKYIRMIEKGEMELDRFLTFYRDKLKKDTDKIIEYSQTAKKLPSSNKRGAQNYETLGKCPICDGNIIDKGSKSKVYSCSNAKYKKEGDNFINEGCQYVIYKTSLSKFGKKSITKTDVKKLLKDGFFYANLTFKNGKTSKVKIVQDEKYGIKLDFNN
jgi:DNA topoisomerase-3